MTLDPSLYLDYSATTPPHPEVVAAMSEAMLSAWGNPSSIHPWGEQAALAMETARYQVADLIGADPQTLTFTSGGTESNNLALLGVAAQCKDPRHLIISSIEHSSVENAAQQLEQQGWSVTRLPVSSEGLVSPESLREHIQPDTVLVSIHHGQNEVGSVQPVATLGSICREAGILFHSDCVQTAGRIPVDVESMSIDLLSMSSHKLYGPKGIGVLYCRQGVLIQPMLRGGGQEGGLRSGTQAVPTIVGFGKAAELARQTMTLERHRLQHLQRHFHQALSHEPQFHLTGPTQFEYRLPHHLSYCVEGLTGTAIVQHLSQAHIAASAGSACNRGQLKPSRILLAMGHTSEQALGSVRLSLGKATTTAAVDYAATVLTQIARAVSPAVTQSST